MGQAQFLADSVSTGVLVVWWESVLFFAVLPTFFRWWDSLMGRLIASLEILLLAGFTPGALHRMLGINVASLAYLWLAAVVLWLIAVRLPWALWALFRLQTEELPPREALRVWARRLPSVLAAPWRRAWHRAWGRPQGR